MMNEWLAGHYNTNGAAAASQVSSEDTEKVAHAELFAKLAAKHGIDLTKMSAEDTAALYMNVFPEEAAKLAQEDEKKDEEDKKPPPFPPKKEEKEEDEEKEAAARAHWQEKVASQEKLAEADFMGRVMAHAFTDELSKIKQAAANPTQRAEVAGVEKAKKASAPTPTTGLPKNAAVQAFEELAATRAVGMAKQAGYDEQEAFNRINSVYILGLEESEKTASVQDYDQGLDVRALEYLEAAKYPVNWEGVFSKAS
jgi:hypothetical protein